MSKRQVHFGFLFAACAIALVLQSCAKHNNEAVITTSSAYHAITVANGGSISGTVTIDGGAPVVPPMEINHDNDACGAAHVSPRLTCSANGAVKFAVVYLENIKEGAALTVPSAPVTITQKGCSYEPHLLAVPVGTTISVVNEDNNVLHNVHVLLGDTTIWNQAQPMFEQTNNHTMTRPGLMEMRCDAGHIWMSGYIFVTEHPYYAVTNDSGKFFLSNIPAGTYSLVCWHEGWNATAVHDAKGDLSAYTYDAPHIVRREITIAAGTTTAMDVTIPR